MQHATCTSAINKNLGNKEKKTVKYSKNVNIFIEQPVNLHFKL